MRFPPLRSVLPFLLAFSACDSSAPLSATGTGGSTATGGSPATGGGSAGGGQSGQSGQSGQGGGASDEIQTIIATYQTWEPQSAAAVDISAEIFSLCRGPTAAERAFTESVHSHFQLRDWANPKAVAGVATKGAGGFAVGAAIVKEKFASPGAGAAFQLAALGMMIKRPPGFDPAGGDWEFVYWTASEGVSRGPVQLPTCTSCHVGAGATDFVFLDDSWRQQTAP